MNETLLTEPDRDVSNGCETFLEKGAHLETVINRVSSLMVGYASLG